MSINIKEGNPVSRGIAALEAVGVLAGLAALGLGAYQGEDYLRRQLRMGSLSQQISFDHQIVDTPRSLGDLTEARVAFIEQTRKKLDAEEAEIGALRAIDRKLPNEGTEGTIVGTIGLAATVLILGRRSLFPPEVRRVHTPTPYLRRIR